MILNNISGSFRKRGLLILAFLFAILLMIYGFTENKSNDIQTKVDQWYNIELTQLCQQVRRLQQKIIAGEPVESLQQAFTVSKLQLAKMYPLINYFNIYEAKLLNGAAIPRIEDDNPHTVIPPQGFQKLEELLWNQPDSNIKDQALEQVSFILEVINRLANEPDRAFKFQTKLIWDALHTALTRIITIGITGFDSPVAFLSLSESISSLKGINEIMRLVAANTDPKLVTHLPTFENKIAGAIYFLEKAESFDRFDRLTFIKEHINPLSSSLKSAISEANLLLPAARRPLKPKVFTVFDKDAFDIDFFSPNERYRVTNDRVALGYKLFGEEKLSGTATRSCITCHKPALAFTDGLPKAEAIDNSIKLRNTPTLFNAAFQTRQFYDSRQTMLEFQINDVVHNPAEMNGMLDDAAGTLANDPEYLTAFKKSYPSDSPAITRYTILNALASYIRSLQSLNARFDQYMRNENVPFSELEKQGFNLFMGRAKCGTCHFMPLFNGLVPPVFTETESEVLGVPINRKKKTTLDPDSGKFYFTGVNIHLHAFKTTTVRNVELTAPYMHNGVFNSLEEVVDFYDKGGGAGLGIKPFNQTLPPDKLDLSKKEKASLIAFMKTLTDTSAANR